MKRLWISLLAVITAACQTTPDAPVTDYSVTGERTAVASAAPRADAVSRGSGDNVTFLLDRHYASWRGVPHRYGGASRAGVDCSAFVLFTYRDVFGEQLPRTTRAQAKLGKRVSKRRLRAGDLVFFKIGWRQRHVGIYVGDGQFIHASESQGVARSSLDNPYWRTHYWKARRLF